MASAATKPDTAETPVPASGKRGGVKLLLIILLAVVLIFAIVTTVFIVLLVTKKKGPGGEPAASLPPAATAPMLLNPVVDLNKPPIFVQLEPFTVNLRSGENENTHYLQTEIALRVSEQKTADLLKGWMPEIRNRINLILTSKSIFDVQNDLSHERVQSEILRGLNAMFGIPPSPPEVPQAQGPLGPIQGVLFISFIVQ